MIIQTCPVWQGRDGLFEVSCPKCYGSGYRPEEDKPFAQCHTCYGDGTIEVSVCPRCCGVGEVDEDDDEMDVEED
ncbi:molecular chaperone DnaJ [Escherichia coli]|uniref:Molecular chaperone DnaJ n=1 Tax=Escherichia coli TaxID=562 RepID=A0A8T6QHR0_ECOLX|nr:molecular chaperone DnaJ [Escherichia coli]EGF7419370.1 molecular chaperone DnaJ [Escherichia coli]EIJ2768656.1 molecular chaperone DnaJ [Escherichia coli]EIY8849600.1 molecular chaperone DnaJ [Escherichia coli]EIZ6053959.1 molecular chaperone DnaJ [Escherichia coli]